MKVRHQDNQRQGVDMSVDTPRGAIERRMDAPACATATEFKDWK
jgi:hypothetical protein